MKLLPLIILIIAGNLYSQNVNHFTTLKKSFIADSLSKSTNDTLSVKDSTLAGKKIIYDSLKYYYQRPLYENDIFIDRDVINRVDYRYAGDILKLFPFTFIRDYGSIGHPVESMLYGVGNNAVTYLQDGLLLNNVLTNSLDLNLIQTGFIDSVEIIPSTRGFLYGTYNNPVAINFITKDFLSKVPFSRIKYYQGAYGEALVDGIFNARISNRFNASFDITNRRSGRRYINSAFSLWQANLKLKYFLSSKINLLANYDFVHSKTGLNGGVDVDSILASTSNIDSVMYNEILAPVNYPNRNENVKRHFFNLRALGSLGKNFFSEFNIYYKYFQSDITNSNYTSPKIINKNKVYGLSFNQIYTQNHFNINLIANYLNANLQNFIIPNSTELISPYFGTDRIFTLSAKVSASMLDSTLFPSIFYKYSNESTNKYLNLQRNTYYGAGFDLNYRLLKRIKLYIGYSVYQTAVSMDYVNDWQIGANAHFNPFDIGATIFNRKNFVYPFLVSGFNPRNYAPDLTGISANLKLRLWKFNLITRTAYYTGSKISSSYFIELPKLKITSGLYYEGILFNSNLNLKAGFIMHYNDKMHMPVSYSPSQFIPSSLTVDFTLSGVIQKVAIVYFTFENLFNRRYYLIPYYPMPLRNIRFGLAWELFD